MLTCVNKEVFLEQLTSFVDKIKYLSTRKIILRGLMANHQDLVVSFVFCNFVLRKSDLVNQMTTK